MAEKLCVHVKTGLEPRCFDFESVGSKGKVYYESYFYIVAMGTKRMESGTEEDLVLDVPQGKAVIITNKVILNNIYYYYYYKSTGTIWQIMV